MGCPPPPTAAEAPIAASAAETLILPNPKFGSQVAAPLAVSAYIAAAYWFTASTSFANPAVTLARGFTDTFAGIDLRHVAPFIGAQIAGAGLALLADRAWR